MKNRSTSILGLSAGTPNQKTTFDQSNLPLVTFGGDEIAVGLPTANGEPVKLHFLIDQYVQCNDEGCLLCGPTT